MRALERSRRRWARLCITALAAASGVVLTTSAGAGETPPTEMEAAARPTVGAVEGEQAAAISELRRPRRPDDALPAAWEAAIREAAANGRGWGANPDLSRRTAPGVWIVPGRGYVCLASSSPSDGSAGFGCASNEDVGRGRLAPSDVDGNGTGVLTGIVPDGVPSVELVDRDGSARSASVARNTYRAPIDADLSEARFTDGGGIRHVLPLEWRP